MVWIKTVKKQLWIDTEDLDTRSRKHDTEIYDEGGREEYRRKRQRHHDEGRHSDLGFD